MSFTRSNRLFWAALAALVGTLGLCESAMAQGSGNDFSRSGPYLSLSGMWVTDLYENELEDQLRDAFGPVNVDIENSGGISARAGVRIGPVIALELQYDWVSDYEVEFDVPGLPNDQTIIDVSQQTLTANLRLNVPLGRVQPFFLAGIGFQRFRLDGVARLGPTLTVREKASDTVLAGRVGTGLEVYLNENFAVLVEATAVLTDEEFDLGGQTINNIFYAGIGLGATYRF